MHNMINSEIYSNVALFLVAGAEDHNYNVT